jgi:hypothetical protein
MKINGPGYTLWHFPLGKKYWLNIKRTEFELFSQRHGYGCRVFRIFGMSFIFGWRGK